LADSKLETSNFSLFQLQILGSHQADEKWTEGFPAGTAGFGFPVPANTLL